MRCSRFLVHALDLFRIATDLKTQENQEKAGKLKLVLETGKSQEKM